jgi:uncharacterized protein with FMN-binding domain
MAEENLQCECGAGALKKGTPIHCRDCSTAELVVIACRKAGLLDHKSVSSSRAVPIKLRKHGLVALSSAAILAVYVVGYERTSTAANRFAAQNERRPSAPVRSQFVAPAEALPSPGSGETFRETPAITDIAAPSRSDERRIAEAPPTAARPSPENVAASASTLTPPPAPAPHNDLAVPTPEEPEAPAATALTPALPIAVPTAAAPDPPVQQQGLYKDGTYTGWGSCRHGDIEASVVIQGGRIASASISQCYTRYPCSWISNAPGQVVSRQSIDVDYVSGATQSINAFRDAVYEALSKAK